MRCRITNEVDYFKFSAIIIIIAIAFLLFLPEASGQSLTGYVTADEIKVDTNKLALELDSVEAGTTPNKRIRYWFEIRGENMKYRFSSASKKDKLVRLHAIERMKEFDAMVERGDIKAAERAKDRHLVIAKRLTDRIERDHGDESSDLRAVIEFDHSNKIMDEELEAIRLRLEEKINSGDLTDLERDTLLELLGDFESEFDRIKIVVKDRENDVVIKIALKEGRSVTEIENELFELKKVKRIRAYVFPESDGLDTIVKVRYEFEYRDEGSTDVNIVQLGARALAGFFTSERAALQLLQIVEVDELSTNEHEEIQDVGEELEETLTDNAFNQIGVVDGSVSGVSGVGIIQLSPGEILRVEVEGHQDENGIKLSVRMILKYLTDARTKESIAAEIPDKTFFTPEEIRRALNLKFEHMDRDDAVRRIKIIIYPDAGVSEINIVWGSRELDLVVEFTNEEKILNHIALALGIPVDRIREVAEIEWVVKRGEFDPDDPTVCPLNKPGHRYIGFNAVVCESINIECEDNENYFADDCGCGCKNSAFLNMCENNDECSEGKACIEGNCESVECIENSSCDSNQNCIENECINKYFDTIAECEAAGGNFVGDPGDGSVTCNDNQINIGGVSVGIEGGLCCQDK